MKNINNVSGRSFQELDETEMQGIFGAGDVAADEKFISAVISLSVVGTVSYISGIHSYEVQCLG